MHGGIASAQTQSEWWPELDVFWQPSERFRVFALAGISRAAETRHREGTLGLHVDWLRLPRGYVRVGYRSISDIPRGEDREQRGIAELTVYEPLGGARLANRTRLDLRWIAGDFSLRLRDRLRLERPVVTPWRQRLVPYAMDEVFYDFRYRAIVRNRVQLGAEFPLTPHVGLDLFYLRQDDSRSDVRHVNALGVALVLSY